MFCQRGPVTHRVSEGFYPGLDPVILASWVALDDLPWKPVLSGLCLSLWPVLCAVLPLVSAWASPSCEA